MKSRQQILAVLIIVILTAMVQTGCAARNWRKQVNGTHDNSPEVSTLPTLSIPTVSLRIPPTDTQVPSEQPLTVVNPTNTPVLVQLESVTPSDSQGQTTEDLLDQLVTANQKGDSLQDIP
jgi:hypothetical protein